MNRHRTGRLAAAVAGCALTALPAGACFADPENVPPYDGIGGGDVFWMMFKVIGLLVILIGLFLLVIRLVAQKNKNLMSGRSVKALGGLPLGQNKSVQIVQIGHTLYVLGVGNDVRLLAKIDDPDEIRFIDEYLHHSGSRPSSTLPTVGEWWKRLRRREQSEEADLSSSFQAVLHEKMQRLTNKQKQVEDMLLDENYADRLTDKDG